MGLSLTCPEEMFLKKVNGDKKYREISIMSLEYAQTPSRHYNTLIVQTPSDENNT